MLRLKDIKNSEIGSRYYGFICEDGETDMGTGELISYSPSKTIKLILLNHKGGQIIRKLSGSFKYIFINHKNSPSIRKSYFI